MKRLLLCLGAAVAIGALTGCSGDDGEIELTAATAPLTANGNDVLFTLRIVEAREGGYAPDGLTVKVIADDAEPLTVTCTHEDANTNAKLDANDKLACTETATNQLGVELAGKELDVELYAKVDGEETKVGSATWTPAK